MTILAAPASEAQTIASRLDELGISGILNFTPVSLSISKRISIVDVDLALELQRLTIAVVNSEQSSKILFFSRSIKSSLSFDCPCR